MSSVSIRGKSSLDGHLRKRKRNVAAVKRRSAVQNVKLSDIRHEWDWNFVDLPAHGLLDDFHPVVPVIFGSAVQLVHLRRRGVADEEHPSLLIGYIPDDQVLERQHWWLVLNRDMTLFVCCAVVYFKCFFCLKY